MNYCFIAFAAAASLLCSSSYAETGYAPETLRSPDNFADYIVIASPDFADALRPLMDHRTSGGQVVLLATTDRLADEFGIYGTGPEHIAAFVRYAYFQWRPPAPRYLLLAGDASPTGATHTTGLDIPTNILYSRYPVVPEQSKTIASDSAYGDMDGDGAPEIAVGRIPADSPEELGNIVEKIISYETWPPAGLWKRRLTFIMSRGDSGAVDKVVEKMYRTIIRDNISPAIDVNMTCTNPETPYFYPLPQFNKKVIERYNDGSLMMLYIGHGFTGDFGKVGRQGQEYPIMRIEDVPLLNAAGRLPFMVISACLTGNIDATGTDSISKVLLKKNGGPVGVISASAVSQPYSNTIFNMAIFRSVFQESVPTLGMALVRAQHELLYGENSEERNIIEKFAIEKFGGSIYTKAEMLAHNRETVFMYNLLGDPATKIQLPPGDIAISAPETATAGDSIDVSGTTARIKSGEAHVELACLPTDIIYPVKNIDGLEGETLEKTIKNNYRNANNKSALEKVVGISDGKFEVNIRIPDFLPGNIYYIKVMAVGADGLDALGAQPIKIKANIKTE